MRTKPSTKLASSTLSAIDALDKHWTAFDAARQRHSRQRASERPPGGVTTQEYAERYGMAEYTARYELTKMLAAGDVTRVSCLIEDKGNRLMPTWVYVPCQAKS